MLQLPFYAPDQAFADNKIGASDYIINLYPLADGYCSVPDFVRISKNKLDGLAIGSISVVLADDANSHFTIVGTTKGLISISNVSAAGGLTFTDISKEGGYNLTNDDFWSFTLYGNYIIANNKNYQPQILDLRDTANFKFKDLTEAPRGTHVKVWGNHLVMVGVLNEQTGYRNMVAWSGLNNPHDWKFTDTSSDADEQQFFDGGVVLNASSSKNPLIFARNKIYRGSYVPSSSLLFTFTDISDQIGLKGINSVIKIDDATYFYSDKGFYRIDTHNNILNIGNSLVNNYVATLFSSGALLKMIVIKDYMGTRIFWAISRTSSYTIYDFILVYDYVLNKWSTINRVVQNLIDFTTFGKTLEDLDVVNDLDDLPFSLDSTFWQQDSRITAGIDSEGYLVSMSGSSMEASIRTGTISDNNNGFLTMTASSLDTDANNYNIDLLYTDKRSFLRNYNRYFKKYKIPISRYRNEAIFNIRSKYIKIQYNIESYKTPYSIYSFTYRTIANGYM